MNLRKESVDLIIAFDKFKEMTGKNKVTIDTGKRKVILSMVEIVDCAKSPLKPKCKLCKKEVDQEEWDAFSGMHSKCENESCDLLDVDKEEGGQNEV